MRKIAVVIIIIGILVMLSPIVGKLYMQWQEDKLIEEWYNSEDAATTEASTISDANAAEAFNQLQDAFSAEAGNANGANSIMPESTGDKANSPSGTAAKPSSKTQTVLGIIKIDKIRIKYPVVEGVKLSNLSRAIGHVPGTAGLGQPGNCSLAGHRNYTFGRYFNRLDEVQTGDIISITTKKAEFRYRVYEKLVVKPDDVSVLKGGKEDTILTLITCTPIYVASHRLILHARLDETILFEP